MYVRTAVPAMVLAAVVAGCQTAPPVFRAAPAEAGRLEGGDEGLRFTPCGAPDARVLVDATGGRVAALVAAFDGEPLMVLVRLVDDRVTDLRYGGLEGPGCDRLPAAGDLEARGNEPFWLLAVDGRSARLATPARIDGVALTDGRWQSDEGGWRYQARSDEASSPDLTLTVVEVPCVDSMSGAQFPYHATLSFDGVSMTGCALEGRTAIEAGR